MVGADGLNVAGLWQARSRTVEAIPKLRNLRTQSHVRRVQCRPRFPLIRLTKQFVDDPKLKPGEHLSPDSGIAKGDVAILLLRVTLTTIIFLALFWAWQTYVLDPFAGRGRHPTQEELIAQAKKHLETNQHDFT